MIFFLLAPVAPHRPLRRRFRSSLSKLVLKKEKEKKRTKKKIGKGTSRSVTGHSRGETGRLWESGTLYR